MRAAFWLSVREAEGVVRRLGVVVGVMAGETDWAKTGSATKVLEFKSEAQQPKN